MVLSHDDLVRAIEADEICFDPGIEASQIGEASVDLRLGYQFTKYREDLPNITLSVAEGLKTIGELNIWKTSYNSRTYYGCGIQNRSAADNGKVLRDSGNAALVINTYDI